MRTRTKLLIVLPFLVTATLATSIVIRIELIPRMIFMHRVKSLAKAHHLAVLFRSPNGSWVQKFSSSEPKDTKSVVSDLLKHGIWQCSNWQSKCPFWIKCEFTRSGSTTEVYLAVDGCNQFHFSDWEWQGKFAISSDGIIKKAMDEFRRIEQQQ